MKLEELKVHQMAMDIGERVWEQVNEWDIFAKDTVGKQFVKAADSIVSNISEGYGATTTRKTDSSATTAAVPLSKRPPGSTRRRTAI